MTDPATPIIDCRDLLVAAGRKRLLELQSLRVLPGEAVAVLGRNGAGKTTLLEILCGLRRPRRGSVSVLAHRLHEMTGFALTRVRHAIGYLPQRLAIPGDLPVTTREVVAIGRSGIRGLFQPLTREDWQHVDGWIDRLGLRGQSWQPYATLSGGEQRRTLLARVMVQSPRVLLLDEPATHLDLSAREQIVRVIEELHATGKLTLILVCHELETIPRCCRRVLILDEGRIVADGTPERVLDADRVRRLYGAEIAVEQRAGRWLAVPAQPERTSEARDA